MNILQYKFSLQIHYSVKPNSYKQNSSLFCGNKFDTTEKNLSFCYLLICKIKKGKTENEAPKLFGAFETVHNDSF